MSGLVQVDKLYACLENRLTARNKNHQPEKEVTEQIEITQAHCQELISAIETRYKRLRFVQEQRHIKELLEVINGQQPCDEKNN